MEDLPSIIREINSDLQRTEKAAEALVPDADEEIKCKGIECDLLEVKKYSWPTR